MSASVLKITSMQLVVLFCLFIVVSQELNVFLAKILSREVYSTVSNTVGTKEQRLGNRTS